MGEDIKYKREIYIIKSKDSGELQSRVNKFIDLNGGNMINLDISFNICLDYYVAFLDYSRPAEYKINNRLI